MHKNGGIFVGWMFLLCCVVVYEASAERPVVELVYVAVVIEVAERILHVYFVVVDECPAEAPEVELVNIKVSVHVA